MSPEQPPTHVKTVLIVEDDESMSVALCDGFGFEGYRAHAARDGEEALRLAAEVCPDLIILDVMLPRVSGHEVCTQLRAQGNDVPIIMLTARGQEIDKVLGLKLGADDYVTKPFSFLELTTRAEALLRRASGTVSRQVGETHTFGDVTLDFKRHQADKAGRPLDLTSREMRILELLARRQGAAVSRQELLQEVWGYENIPITRTVDSHIAKLRKKIEDQPANPKFLITVHGVGYKLI